MSGSLESFLVFMACASLKNMEDFLSWGRIPKILYCGTTQHYRKVAHGADIYAGTLILDFTAHNCKTQIKPSGQESSLQEAI